MRSTLAIALALICASNVCAFDPVIANSWGGGFGTVGASGEIAYVGRGIALEVWDIGDPSNPSRVREILMPDTVSRFQREGALAFVQLGWQSYSLLDLSDAWNPQVLGHFDMSDRIYKPLLRGDRLVHWTRGGIVFQSVADPTSPEFLFEVEVENLRNLDINGDLLLAVLFKGHVSIAESLWEIKLISTADPTSAETVWSTGDLTLEKKPNARWIGDGIYVRGGSFTNTWLRVYDATIPASTELTVAFDIPAGWGTFASNTLLVGDSTLYAPNLFETYQKWYSTHVWDVSDPLNPVQLEDIGGEIPGFDGATAFVGNHFLNVHGDGMTIYEIRGGGFPSVASVDTFIHGVSDSDARIAMVADDRDLYLFDESDRLRHLRHRGVFEPQALVSADIWPTISEMALVDEGIVATVGPGYYNNRLTIRHFDSQWGVIDSDSWLMPRDLDWVAIDDGLLAVASDSLESSISLFDVSDPVLPEPVGEMAVERGLGAIALQGDALHVVGANHGPRIYDVSSPVTPELMTDLSGMPGNEVGVWLNGEMGVILSAGDPSTEARLTVIDLSNLSSPEIAGSVALGGFTGAHHGAKDLVFLDGELIYVDGDLDAMYRIDISDSASPEIVGAWNLPGGNKYGLEIERMGPLLLAVTEAGGILVLADATWLAEAPGAIMDALLGFSPPDLEYDVNMDGVIDIGDLVNMTEVIGPGYLRPVEGNL